MDDKKRVPTTKDIPELLAALYQLTLRDNETQTQRVVTHLQEIKQIIREILETVSEENKMLVNQVQQLHHILDNQKQDY